MGASSVSAIRAATAQPQSVKRDAHTATASPAPPRYDEAFETHGLVNATFALVVVTVLLAAITTAAIIIPLRVSSRQRRQQMESALAELDAIASIVEDQLRALAGNPSALVAGSGIEFVIGRAFAADIAQAIGEAGIAELYSALARAGDVIIACRQHAAESRDRFQMPNTAAAHARNEVRIREEQALKSGAETTLRRIQEARKSLANGLVVKTDR